MRRHFDRNDNLPKNTGKLSIFPSIQEGHHFLVTIVGDSEGMRYFARVLDYMADVQVAKQDMPEGARAHIPLHPGLQLIDHLSEVQICRAAAKGSETLAEYFPTKLAGAGRKRRG